MMSPALSTDRRAVLLSPTSMALLSLVVAVGLYSPSWFRMAQMWQLGTYQHCWLVLPIVVWIISRDREKLDQSIVQSSIVGGAALIVLVVAWHLANTLNVQVVEFLVAVLLAPATYWTVAGLGALRAAAFPFMFLLFAVPAGDALVEPLMEATAWISTQLLHFTGIPALREGMFITLPGGVFEVARVCAGLRFLLAGLMVALAYSYLSIPKWRLRLLFALLTIVSLVLANGIRAFLIMVVASKTQMRWLTGDDHIYFGYLVFALVIVFLIFFAERYLSGVEADQRSGPKERRPGSPSFRPVPVVVAVFLLTAGPAAQLMASSVSTTGAPLAALPEIDSCDAPSGWEPDWSPTFTAADQYRAGSYQCMAFRLHVWIAAYDSQEQGKELISSANRIWPRSWRRYVDEHSDSARHGSELHTTNAWTYTPPGNTAWSIRSWFEVGDRRTESAIEVKLLEAKDALSFRQSRGSVYILAFETDEDEQLASDEIRAVVQVFFDRNARS